MDDSRLKAICEAKLANALGWVGGRLSKDRILAMSYYQGDLFGNEQEGRSKVVSRDVAEAVDSVMPSLVKVFATTDTVIMCQARKPGDEAMAQQATDYLNWVFQSQDNAFDLLQTWLKDGLMSKLGVVKSWWDEQDEVKTERYEGLTRFQYLVLISDENVEPVEVQARPAPAPILDPGAPVAPVAPGAPAPLGQETIDDGLVYDCIIARGNRTGRIRIEAIPPEEFLTDRRAVSLESATFCAHRCIRRVSDLIEMGYARDVVERLPGGSELDFNAEVLTRFEAEDLDESMRRVWVAECYLKVDFNGDGVAEWRRVMLAGGGGWEILENEECDGHPFSAWTPNKMPHKLYGESLADKTMDLQLIKSTVWRQCLDGMYFNNAPQLVVVEGQANMEDVLTRRPGGVIRVRSGGAVTPLPVQDVSQPAFGMINYLDSVREARTGVRRFSSGLDADALNPYANTATGARLVEDSSQDRIMLLARNFAEQGLKPLFGRLLELICKHQDKPQTVRLRGQWVDIDPSTWATKMDMTVTVGLGTGNRETQVGQLLTMLTQIDQAIVQAQGGLKGPLVTAANVYNKLAKLTEAMGYRNVDAFYTDPSTIPPPPPPSPAPPPPNPMMQMAQAQIALDQAKAQGALQLKQQGAAAQAALDRQKAAHAMELDRLKAEHGMALDKLRATAEIELERQKAGLNNPTAGSTGQNQSEIASLGP